MLPREYTRVEWIQGNGDVYAGTNFIANQDTRIVMDFQSLRTTGGWPIIGSRASSSSRTFTFGSTGTNNAWLSGYNNGSVNSGKTEDSNRHTVDKNKNLCYLDGVLIASSVYATFTTPGEVRIFKFNSTDGDSAAFASLRVWSILMYDNTVLARDYFPFVDESGVANLWDDVTLTTATKYGTFTYGPALIPTAPANFRRTNDDRDSVVLAWEPSEYANYYIIKRNGEQISDVDGDVLVYVDRTVEAGNTYIYEVVACNGTQVGGSASVEVEVKRESILIPIILTALIAPNPTDINTRVTLTVTVTETEIILEPYYYYSGEVYAGEI